VLLLILNDTQKKVTKKSTITKVSTTITEAVHGDANTKLSLLNIHSNDNDTLTAICRHTITFL